ncbi:MAG TPA: hypothetical protein VK461_08870 [Acidimicrobiales bacterium]|nr:hypothetical protein [Acidimicrobiales bacterium]
MTALPPPVDVPDDLVRFVWRQIEGTLRVAVPGADQDEAERLYIGTILPSRLSFAMSSAEPLRSDLVEVVVERTRDELRRLEPDTALQALREAAFESRLSSPADRATALAVQVALAIAPPDAPAMAIELERELASLRAEAERIDLDQKSRLWGDLADAELDALFAHIGDGPMSLRAGRAVRQPAED